VKIFRAFERVEKDHARSSVIVSKRIPLGTDLLAKAGWEMTKPLIFNESYVPKSWGPVVQPIQPWVEGNAVRGPDGAVYNLLRLENGWSVKDPIGNKAILLRAPHATALQEFVEIIDMPGGSSK
jgi:hypothetical protein